MARQFLPLRRGRGEVRALSASGLVLLAGMLAACGEAAPAPSPTASRGIIISSLPTATRAPAQQSAGPAGAGAVAPAPGGPASPGAPAPAAGPRAAPTVNSSQFPYAAPTTLTNSALATAVAPGFATVAAATAIVATAQAIPTTPPQPPPAAAAQPATAPTATPIGSFASVTVSDSGFSPALVNVKVGGTVQWSDAGQRVHSASAPPGSGPIGPGVGFDTGGFGPGQTASLVFQTAGTYSYTSQPDCLNGNSTPGFNCTTYTVVVVP